MRSSFSYSSSTDSENSESSRDESGRSNFSRDEELVIEEINDDLADMNSEYEEDSEYEREQIQKAGIKYVSLESSTLNPLTSSGRDRRNYPLLSWPQKHNSVADDRKKRTGRGAENDEGLEVGELLHAGFGIEDVSHDRSQQKNRRGRHNNENTRDVASRKSIKWQFYNSEREGKLEINNKSGLRLVRPPIRIHDISEYSYLGAELAKDMIDGFNIAQPDVDVPEELLYNELREAYKYEQQKTKYDRNIGNRSCIIRAEVAQDTKEHDIEEMEELRRLERLRDSIGVNGKFASGIEGILGIREGNMDIVMGQSLSNRGAEKQETNCEHTQTFDGKVEMQSYGRIGGGMG
ncbi:hypothetical protein AX774_g6024 [Zancudomyces culisetae]|uniref:Uncharacterized protein n=1 Tax=Zancudomyces culisetae TaxID=1213189 RepID=A0A1R1PHS2_ZANCU|nr:hypothetical protein AX774_g6024 [Zancudomyces culisetae]|eukprot:OMH80530.1 hypothetical protein AX774_g6024 [Zancudomyces culisetae]